MIYAVTRGASYTQIELDELGDSGWELVCSYGENKLILKRPCQK